MKERILITGGFGYLGGRMATYLAGQSYIIRLGTRKSQPSPDWLPQAEVAVMDILDPASLVTAMQAVDTVIHLAAMNENESVNEPAKAIEYNTLGTHQVLQAAINADVKRFIYFSTAHIYCAPLVGHIDETFLPKPLHPYAITHHGAEDFVRAAYLQGKIAGIIIRLSNGFGAPADPGVNRWTLLVNDVCRQVAENKKIVLRSSGIQKRDFITLDDVNRAMEHLLQLPVTLYGDGLFNLGGETSISIWELVQRIAHRCKIVLGFDPEIIRPEPAAGETTQDLFFDMSKFKKTGFVLHGDIDKEIDNTLLMSVRFFTPNN